LNVQYGAAGTLAVLVRGAACGYSSAADALPLVTSWTHKRLDQSPRILPGLYFGRAGTVWALREAADQLGDPDLAATVEEFGLRIPVRWPNPDICHGAAGGGLAYLRLWQLTHRGEFLDRARDCADGLLATARQTEDGVYWPVPGDFDSELAGAWFLGFAHGVAGVAAFLLAAAQACGDPRYLDMANAAGETLAAAADIDPRTGAATWRTDRERQHETMLFYWCNGASGVGSFLVRLAAIQAEHAAAQRYWQLVHAAASAVHAARWISPNGSCHGLAGNGQFLLDASSTAREAGIPNAARYREWAEDLAQVLVARYGRLRGRMLIPDESENGVTAGYGTGLAGMLDFLLRLRHGGRRSWMIEFS
jgi:lantibiotic modifying enzyme